MVGISCANHDTYAENSQFITHVIWQMMVSQGLAPTTIETKLSLYLKSYLSILDCSYWNLLFLSVPSDLLSHIPWGQFQGF